MKFSVRDGQLKYTILYVGVSSWVLENHLARVTNGVLLTIEDKESVASFAEAVSTQVIQQYQWKKLLMVAVADTYSYALALAELLPYVVTAVILVDPLIGTDKLAYNLSGKIVINIHFSLDADIVKIIPYCKTLLQKNSASNIIVYPGSALGAYHQKLVRSISQFIKN